MRGLVLITLVALPVSVAPTQKLRETPKNLTPEEIEARLTYQTGTVTLRGGIATLRLDRGRHRRQGGALQGAARRADRGEEADRRRRPGRVGVHQEAARSQNGEQRSRRLTKRKREARVCASREKPCRDPGLGRQAPLPDDCHSHACIR